MIKVLIVDDDKNLRRVLLNELSAEGFQAESAETGAKAIDLVEKNEYDVLLLDLNIPDLNGIEILKRIKASDLPIEVIMITGNATVPTAVEAMKLSAYDYLTKPFKIEELKVVIGKAHEKKALIHENLLLKSQIRRQSGPRQIIAKSAAMLEILEYARKIAQSDFPVLISGESGVGKEVVAKAVHAGSKRAERPFVPINCGAIPETMIESELHGYEKGAFTGSHGKKMGLLEIADQGILFLDEIGELSLPIQVKLLRVIETGRFFRLGGTKEVQVDVRIVSATNKELKKEVEKGVFRGDLYYRISTLSLEIPPLRERKEDIPPLIEHIIETNPAFKGRKLSKAALNVLTRYPWPGNVRELQNVVHRTLLLSKNETIDPDDLPADLRGEIPKSASMRLEDVERDHILGVLRDVGGQRGKAAEILGVDPKTLYRKLQGYGVKE